MSKDKRLRKIVIDKLFNKIQNPMKQSTRSNAPTESTPNQPKNLGKAIQNFFENFQTECAIIYEPVKIRNYKNLKRSLEQELAFLYKNDIFLKIKTQESSSSQKINHSLKSSQKKTINIPRTESQTKIQSYNSIASIKSKQKRTLTISSQIQNLKPRTLLFNSISPSQIKPQSRQKYVETETSLSKKLIQSIKIQKIKIPTEKSLMNGEKIDEQYMTNSKNLITKHIPKNAPKKVLEKPEKIDRMKRIQSLKNLNQNAIRKYSYRRDL